MLTIDGYTDLERIGHGGLGDVYRATRISTGGTVAIKVLRDVSDESVAWNRTRRELTALVSLSGHAHVIQLVEVLEHTPGLVMEYAPGGSVAQLLDRRGTTLDVAELALIGRQTASALAAAHEQGIVHRDVKPQNLLVDGFGQIKLCDFGIASLARTEEFRTRTSAISMRYASPEDLEDDTEVGPPSDVYSLGASLLHLSHGAPPTLKERLAPWDPPPTDDPHRAELDRLLARCLQPDPAARPTAAEVVDHLEAVEHGLTDRRRALPLPPPATVAALDTSAESQDGDAPAQPDGLADGSGGSPAPWIDDDDHPAIDLADDPTRYRTGRVPPVPDRPVAPRRSGPKPTTLVGGGLVVATVIVATVVLLSGRDAEAPVPSTTTSTTVPVDAAASAAVVARPGGLVPLDDPSIVWPLGSIGECLVQVEAVDTLQPVDCDDPHDLQRFAVGALDESVTSSVEPDDAELELAVADLCLEAAPPSWPLPELRVAQTNPSAGTWSEGDRGYQCLLGVPGRRLTGSALDGR